MVKHGQPGLGVTQVSGFQWVDDTTSYGSHRWGWASEKPGDSIEVQVTRLQGFLCAGLAELALQTASELLNPQQQRMHCTSHLSCNTTPGVWPCRKRVAKSLPATAVTNVDVGKLGYSCVRSCYLTLQTLGFAATLHAPTPCRWTPPIPRPQNPSRAAG